MKRWWERFPGRLDREIASLDANGIEQKRDDAAWADGRLVLNLTMRLPGQPPLALVAIYPDTFPYTRFEVIAPDLNLPRHQNPFGKHLCLMGRATANWSVAFTIGGTLSKQIPKLLRFASEEYETLRILEEAQGEPFSDYYGYLPGSAVLVDSGWDLDPNIPTGRLVIGYEQTSPFRGAVLEILDMERVVIERTEPCINRHYENTLKARWVRWHEPINEPRPDRILALVATKYPELLGGSVTRQRAAARGDPELVGIVYPEEIGQGRVGDAWLFIVRKSGQTYFARPCRAGRSDLASRAPELAPLAQKSAAIVGLGALGAPTAVEMAKSGIGALRLADCDFVEAGTVARWAIGASAIGLRKVDALQAHLARHYPYTAVETFSGVIGGALNVAECRDAQHLESLLAADLIFDATAEPGVQLLLSDMAVEAGKPYIAVSATPGAWGGLIFRWRPGDPACWSCLQHALHDGTIPTPLADSEGHLQPVGCASPTFTGSSFELQQVVLMGVRTAVSTLCAGAPNAFPQSSWNVAVGRFRDPDGGVIAPQWETFSIGKHANCENEAAHQESLDCPVRA